MSETRITVLHASGWHAEAQDGSGERISAESLSGLVAAVDQQWGEDAILVCYGEETLDDLYALGYGERTAYGGPLPPTEENRTAIDAAIAHVVATSEEPTPDEVYQVATAYFTALLAGRCPACQQPYTGRQVRRSVYCEHCGARLYQGKVGAFTRKEGER